MTRPLSSNGTGIHLGGIASRLTVCQFAVSQNVLCDMCHDPVPTVHDTTGYGHDRVNVKMVWIPATSHNTPQGSVESETKSTTSP